MIGTRLGPYEITGKLGEGGMGEVYRATDTRLKREVAIKVLPAAFTEDHERLARFGREAQLLAQLHHPNIASIFGLEESDGVRALVMELVEGPTLQERLESGPPSLTESLTVAVQIAQALEEAHEKGIVHRDLKPQNIKASLAGRVKVLDFGLAKAMNLTSAALGAGVASASALQQSPTLTLDQTQTGMILGTAAYMSPEQARGATVDKRADIWAFGAVLYEMLTGERLFAGGSVADVLGAVMRQPIDLDRLPATTPRGVRELVRRCLERNLKNRLHDIADARIVLDEVLTGTGVGAEVQVAAVAAPPMPAFRRWTPWLGGALAGLAAGLLAVLTVPRAAAPPMVATEAVPTIRMLVATGESADPAVSPDGKTLAFASFREGRAGLWIKDLASGSESVLVRDRSWLPRFSPDGTSLLFTKQEDEGRTALYRISLATREERLVVRDADGGDWLADGRGVVFQRGRSHLDAGFPQLVALDLASGTERVLRRDDEHGMDYVRSSPNGRHFAVSIPSLQTGEADRLGILDLESGEFEEHLLTLPGVVGIKVRGLAWHSARRLTLLLLDGGRVHTAGRVASFDLTTRQLRTVYPLPAVGWGIEVAGKGTLVVGVGSQEQNLYEAARAEGRWSRAELRTEGPFSDRQPVYSPDGRSILFSSDRSGNLDIWQLARESGELRRLTDHDAVDWDPALSADGKRLIFSSNRSGRYQIWIADADGASARQVTDLENAQNPTMTADGQWILFTLQEAGEARNGIWKVRPDGGAAAPVALGALLIPDTSPDGRYVAFRERGHCVLARVADGKRLDIPLPDTDRCRWSVEGRTYLWAIAGSATGNSIRRYPFDAARERLGAAETILSGEEVSEAESLGVARDGSAVAFSQLANRRAQLLRFDGLADSDR